MSNRTSQNLTRACFFFALILLSQSVQAFELSPEVKAGLDLMNHGRLIESYSKLKELHTKNPQSVETTFVLSLAKFRIMWLSTYNAKDKKELNGLLDDVERKCEANLKNKDFLFYHSAVSGMRAQMLATEAQWWQTAQAGKEMKKRAEELVKADPNYYPAYYLLGTYNYFADVLPSAVKFFRSLLFIPGGDRLGGIKQLQLSYQKTNPVSVEAGRTLVLIYTYYEKQYSNGVRTADDLLASYPDNFEIGLYKGVGLYFNQSWTKSGEWLQHLRDGLLAYSKEHPTLKQVEDTVEVYVPMEREARYWIARGLIQQKRYPEAREILTALGQSKVDQPYWLKRWVYLSLAQLDYQDGKSESANHWLDPVLKGMDVKNSHDKAKTLRAKKGKVGMFEIDFQ